MSRTRKLAETERAKIALAAGEGVPTSGLAKRFEVSCGAVSTR